MLTGFVQRLDLGSGNAYATVFDAADQALVSIVFEKPAGTLVSNELVLTQEDASGDLILADGTASYFTLYSGDNVAMGSGSVSDAAGSGVMKMAGTNGTSLFAGGRARVAEFKLV